MKAWPDIRYVEPAVTVCALAALWFGVCFVIGWALGHVEPPLHGRPDVTAMALVAALAVSTVFAVVTCRQMFGASEPAFSAAFAVTFPASAAAGFALGLGLL